MQRVSEVDCEYEEKCEGIKQKNKKKQCKFHLLPFYTKSLQKKSQTTSEKWKMASINTFDYKRK